MAKNTISPEIFYGIPVYTEDPVIASTTVFANASNTANAGNAMTQYRTQQQNNNWLFSNPAAAEFNNFIATNNNFQQSFVQGMQGAGRTLEFGLESIKQWATGQNLMYVGLGVVGLILVSRLLGGKDLDEKTVQTRVWTNRKRK